MTRSTFFVAISSAILFLAVALAQVAGSSVIGVAAAELRQAALGWSAKREIRGTPVHNDANERIGIVDDIIVGPDKAVSYAIVGARGFLGLACHDVAIPVWQLKVDAGRLVISGGTKEALRAMPGFEYGTPTK